MSDDTQPNDIKDIIRPKLQPYATTRAKVKAIPTLESQIARVGEVLREIGQVYGAPNKEGEAHHLALDRRGFYVHIRKESPDGGPKVPYVDLWDVYHSESDGWKPTPGVADLLVHLEYDGRSWWPVATTTPGEAARPVDNLTLEEYLVGVLVERRGPL